MNRRTRQFPESAVEQIERYSVYYYAGGKQVPSADYRAIISMRREDKTLIGVAYFHRDASTMPDTDSRTPQGAVHCHFPWESFSHVLDVLRNESPVFLRFVAGEPSVASIITSPEPVGEGEEV
jgi:hypothetical protein